MLLPDINVWLALGFRLHSHHTAAKAWYQGSSDTCCFCRLTQQGFLRLASNPAVMKQEAVTLQEAWQMYDDLMTDPRVAFAEEPNGMETHWRAFTHRRTFSPHVWNDAYLAAFAKAVSLEIVTFDKGMRQYKGVQSMILS